MRIATFNANSIRVRLDIVLDWLAETETDVLALQEIKCEDHVFPRDAFEELGYHVAVHGQKTYNGVALISKLPLGAVTTGFGDPAFSADARVISADVEGIRLINTYVPNGTKVGSEKWDYKLRWLERMSQCISENVQRSDVIWLGDINIAPEPIDVYDSAKLLGEVGHHPDEFSRLKAIVDHGLVDVFRAHNSQPGQFTYWDFFIKNALDRKLGWRIDHIYASNNLAQRCKSCWIDVEPRRRERPSDHTFVVADFS